MGQKLKHAAIAPILRAWELEASIRGNLYGLRFNFEKAEIIDRTPIVPGETRICVPAGLLSARGYLGAATVRVGWGKYPDPPVTFRVIPNVESLWLRFKGYVDGREPLLSMAYFCLTVLEADAGGRAGAAKKYGIEKIVLVKLGEITSKRGDRLTARKVKGTSPMRPLMGQESAWVQSVVKALILRVGDTRDIVMLPEIKMVDFPKL